ncbi:hypothetical protein LBMAG52_20600 [Planctomycetia bacterium]|nr:hypothetical protein LBMAG52_20600 [Planctomycetia bacterium]
MRRWLALRGLWLALGSCSLLFVSVARAAEPSDAVPDSASVVLRVKAPQTTLGNLGDFVDAVQPGVGAVVRGNVAMLGLAISNPGLAGVDIEKDWWAIVFAESRQQRPAIVFVVPVTDANAVKNALPSGFQFHSADKLAVYSDNEEALGKVRDRLSGKGSALWSKIDASTKKLFEASDLSVLINLQQLTKAFESELQQAEPQLDTLLNQISGAIPDAQRAQLVPMLDIYRVLGKSALQGVRDSQSLTVGFTFSKDAIRVEDRLQVGEGTATAKFFAKQPTSELSLINRLPANKLAYFGLKADMAGMVDWSMKMTKSILANSTDEQKAKFEAAVKDMHTLKWNEMAGYFDLDASAAGAIRAGSISEITPANRLREISHSMLKAMSEIQSVGFKQTTTLETAIDKIDGFEVDRTTMKQEFDGTADPLGIQKRIQLLLFGEAGMQQHMLYQPTRALQTFGGGIDEMKSLAKTLNSTASKDEAVAVARKRYVEKANLIGLIDVARLAANGLKLAAREGAISVDASAIDGLKLQPSFIGLSLACDATGAGAQFEIPVAQAQGIAKVVMLIFNMRNNRN